MLADGFSCRTQIEQAGTGHTPLHLAQVLAAGLHGADPQIPREGSFPSARWFRGRRARRVAFATVAVLTGLGAAGIRTQAGRRP